MVTHTDLSENRPAAAPSRRWRAFASARWFEILTLALIVFLCVVLVLLILENRRYENLLLQAGVIQRDDALKPGERVGEIGFRTLEGGTGTLRFDGKGERYLLFVMSTTCPHCLANLGKWGRISRDLAPSGLYVVGLSLHGQKETAEYIADNGVSFYTVTVPDTAFLDRYRIPGVPATLLLSTGGIVEKVWIGELTEDQVSEVLDQAT